MLAMRNKNNSRECYSIRDLMMHNCPRYGSLCVSVESSAVQTLKVSAVSTSAAVISWNSVPGATGYRLAWGPTQGDLLFTQL